MSKKKPEDKHPQDQDNSDGNVDQNDIDVQLADGEKEKRPMSAVNPNLMASGPQKEIVEPPRSEDSDDDQDNDYDEYYYDENHDPADPKQQ